MRVRRAFMGSLILAFLILSALADRIGLDGLVTLWGILNGDTPRVVTGTVTELHASEWMSVASDTNPIGFRIALRKTTVYEGSPAAIKSGARVTVWYRNVGERHLVSDRVRVLSEAAPR